MYVHFYWSSETETSLFRNLQENLACSKSLIRFIWMVCVMGGKWPYNCSFAGDCFQNSFKTAHSILMHFFSKCFVRVHEVLPYNNTNTTTALKISRLISRSFIWKIIFSNDFQMIDNQSMAFCGFSMRMLTQLSVDEILLPMYVRLIPGSCHLN